MILKALCDLAQAEHLVDDPDFVSADVAYCLSLGQGGKNPRLLPLATERQEGKKTLLELPRITIPREPSRSGTKAPALFLALLIEMRASPAVFMGMCTRWRRR